MRALGCLLVAGLLLGACAEQDDGVQGCEMRSLAELPVLNDRGSPVVPVALNGTKVAFVVDTGARASVIFENAAEKLGLPTDSDHMRLLGGIGGSVFSRIVTVDNLSLGTAIARHVDLDSIPGFSDRVVGGLPVVGLFGGDFLANYDVEFDLPSHMITLFTEHHQCTDNLRPWAQGDYYRQPFHLEGDTAITFDITIDGHREPVMLDSGAYRTIIDSEAGNDSGATWATMKVDHARITRGIDGNAVEARRHRFDSLDIGPEHFAPAYLDVADMDFSGLLGADFFRARKVWVSYQHGMLYVQRVLFPRAAMPTGGGSASAAGVAKH